MPGWEPGGMLGRTFSRGKRHSRMEPPLAQSLFDGPLVVASCS